MKRLFVCISAVLLLALWLGCGPKPEVRTQQGEMDTPEHHVTMAERAIKDSDDWKTAHKQYDLALGLDSNHIPAVIGNAVFYAHEGQFEKAEQLRQQAYDKIGGGKKEVDLAYYTGAVEYYSFVKGDGWLKNSEKAFELGAKIDANNEKLNLAMGKAYMRGYEWSKAEAQFSKVVGMNGSYRENADLLWKKVQKIVRARPGSVAGKKIALVEEITRADVAALFVEEMHLPELWAKRGIKTWETPGYQTPDQMAKDKAKAQGPMASDIADHPLSMDIEACLKLGIRGLEVFPDGEFKPNKPISRAEYAVMLEDIIIKVMNEPGNLASKYVGEQESKFHDMSTSHWAYNAAVVVSLRQVMPGDQEQNFKPDKKVEGADALLIIRQLMDYLTIG